MLRYPYQLSPIRVGFGLGVVRATLSPGPVRLGAMALISVTEAGERYKLSTTRIRQLLRARTVSGTKFGPTWAVDEVSLRDYLATPRKRGRKPRRA